MEGYLQRAFRSSAIVGSVFVLVACDLISSTLTTPTGPRTAEFLANDDFDGQFVRMPLDSPFGGGSVFEGRLVFSNLPRTVVDDVLPPDLKLANNKNPSFPNVHPVALLYGHQTATQWKLPLPWGTLDAGADYRELILIVPFVQRAGSQTWNNYVVRIYLDDPVAMAIGNVPYGYFKELATFSESDSGTVSTVNVVRGGLSVFQWTATALASTFDPHTVALTTLENYQEAIEIFDMPILGTTVAGYVCSYWTWTLGAASVRPIDVQFKFQQPFRVSGMAEWVNQGALNSVEKGAFELKNVNWDMRYPPELACP